MSSVGVPAHASSTVAQGAKSGPGLWHRVGRAVRSRCAGGRGGTLVGRARQIVAHSCCARLATGVATGVQSEKAQVVCGLGFHARLRSHLVPGATRGSTANQSRSARKTSPSAALGRADAPRLCPGCTRLPPLRREDPGHSDHLGPCRDRPVPTLPGSALRCTPAAPGSPSTPARAGLLVRGKDATEDRALEDCTQAT